GYCPRAKRSRSNTRAGPVGYLFETVHNAIAPVWQPGAYIRSCELSSVVERAHSNVARKTKGWLEYEIHHAAETREALSSSGAVDAADNACRNSCCGCLRPPCGGTDAVVPSMILSSACCTTSHHSRNPAGRTRLTHDREGQPRARHERWRRPPPHQSWRKLLRIRDRLGCFSFLSALSSF